MLMKSRFIILLVPILLAIGAYVRVDIASGLLVVVEAPVFIGAFAITLLSVLGLIILRKTLPTSILFVYSTIFVFLCFIASDSRGNKEVNFFYTDHSTKDGQTYLLGR